MLLLLAVSLYTSRVILKVLGIDDYGIYNLIAGFVMFLAFTVMHWFLQCSGILMLH